MIVPELRGVVAQRSRRFGEIDVSLTLIISMSLSVVSATCRLLRVPFLKKRASINV